MARRTRVTALALAGALALASALTLAACSRSANEAPVVNARGGATASATPAPQVAGTRDDPLHPGQSHLLVTGSAWTVALLDADLDAVVATPQAIPANRRPTAGETFVVGTFRLTISAPAVTAQGGDLATEGASAWQSLHYAYVGADGTAYDGTAGTPCATAAPLLLADPLWADGATATGDVCVAVPSAQVAGGWWRVSNGAGDALYFAPK